MCDDVTPKRRGPGRPPLDDDDASISVSLKMTATQYDETYERAQLERVSVPEIIRRDVLAAAARAKLK